MTAAIRKAFDQAEPVVRQVDAPLPLRREMAPAEPYPVDALGELIGSAVKGAADTIQAPVELCAQSALANVALAVQAHANVVLPFADSKLSPISLFLLTVAESGDRKSSADKKLGGAAIEDFEEMRADDVRLERIEYNNAKEAHEAARQAAKSKATKGGDPKSIAAALNAIGSPPVEPLSATLTFGDPTIEGLHKQFAKGQPSAGLFSTEGGAFVGGVGMTPENALKTGAQFSELWDGAPIKRLRVHDGENILRHRRLSLHLMMQPGAAHTWLSNPVLRDQGLFSRLLVCAPKSLAGTRLHRDADPANLRAIRRLSDHLGDLLRHRLPISPDRPGELRPRELPMTPEATRIFRGFADTIECQLGEGGQLESVKGLASKTPEHAGRIAAVLALADDLKVAAIDGETMLRGVALAQWYLSEALRLMEADASSPDLIMAEKVLAWAEKRSSPIFSLACVYQSGPNSVRNMATARRIMAILVDHNQVEELEGFRMIEDAKGKRHRRHECYQVRRG